MSTDPLVPSTIIVGEGMIGSAVSSRMRRRPHDVEWSRPTNWSAPASVGADLSSALADGPSPLGLAIVWAAGRADMKSELDEQAAVDSFRHAVSGVLAASTAVAPTRIHLISSAGALGSPFGSNRFELVDSPYRRMKLNEETTLQELHDDVRIHRVSSVYAAPRASARAGVVGLLVANALRAVETPLFARTVTMRNYLHADDVAEALARAVAEADTSPTLIAARRSHAMNEVVATVRNVVRRPVPINYRPPVNDHDMVFDARSVSTLVPQRSLSAGVRLVYDDIVGR